MKNKKMWVWIILVVVILAIILFILLNNNNQNVDEVAISESLITSQYNKEKDFKTEGYTIDNPNVILNPYGNSPLTALILFETNEEVSPTVTIAGKDENTTFTHTFNASQEHLLSI